MTINNPVLNRELLENLRSPRAFWVQAIFIALLGGVVLVAWPQELELRTMEHDSVELYDTFSQGQFILLILLAPIFSAPAISGERERRSFDLLLTSPLSRIQIVSGKLMGAVVYLLLLAVSSLPIFSLCLRLGAIGSREIIATYLLLFSAAFLSGAIGITASTFMGRSRAALAVSYVLILPLAMVMLLAGGLMRNLGAAAFASAFAFALGMMLVVLVTRRLGKPFDTAPRAAEEENRDEQLGLVLDRSRFPDNLLSAKSEGKPIDERSNPVYDKELRYELFGQGTLLMRLLLQVSLVAALPFFIAALVTPGLWVYSFYALIFIMLLAPSLAGGVFSQERERGTLDLLLTTSIGRGAILRGKLGVSLRSIGVLAAFLVPFMIIYWVVFSIYPEKIIGGVNWTLLVAGTLATLVATAFFAVMLASFLSMICRTTLRSMIFSYMTLGVVFVAPVILYRILTRFNIMPAEGAHWLAITSPFFALAGIESDSFLARGFMLPSGVAGVHIVSYCLIMSVLGIALLVAIMTQFNRFCQFRHDRGL